MDVSPIKGNLVEISRNSDDSNNVFNVNDGNNNNGNSIRPTLNLISSIKYVSGSGTSTDSIRISL